MATCIQSTPHTINVGLLQDDASDTDYYVKVTSSMPTIRVVFTPHAGGSIDGVSVTPSGPSTGDDWVEFTTAHANTIYTVQVDYSRASVLAEGHEQDHHVHPLETPTKFPKFKPQPSCPP